MRAACLVDLPLTPVAGQTGAANQRQLGQGPSMWAAGVNARAVDNDIDPEDYEDDEDEGDDEEEDEEDEEDDDENGPKWYVRRWCRVCTESHAGA